MKQIAVTVNIFGYLKELYPHLSSVAVVELDRPRAVGELIAALGISSKMVLFATVEGRMVDKNRLLDHPCELNLISPPAGG